MKRILFALAALALILPATARVSKGADVSVDFFYNNMSGGSWVEVADYGYCWQPDVAVSNTSWRPYADGYWAYTDLGWTWVSYEDFGWATYHYGRWARLSDYGWVWVPGRDEDMEWGPAWVSWRTGGEYIGWAPLPPSGERVYQGRAISGQVDVELNIGPDYYNFVDVRYIGEPVLRERIVERSQNVTYINQTVNVTNITYKNKTVYNYGPDINVINTRASRPIQRLKLERQENVDVNVAVKSGGLMKPQGDKLIVGAPMHIKKSEKQLAPPTVKTKIAKANLDTGWSGVSDPDAQTQLKNKMKTEDAKNAQIGAGAGVSGQASPGPSAGASVSAAAGASVAPFEKGKGKHKNQIETNAAGAAGASPAPATSPVVGPSPAGAAGSDAITGREHGKHNKPQGEKLLNTPTTTGAKTGVEATTSPVGGATGAPEGMSQPGGGKHNRRMIEPANSPLVQGTPLGDASIQGQGEGQHKGRHVEQPSSLGQPGNQPGGNAELQGQGGGKHKNRDVVQPSGAQSDAPAAGGPPPGKAEGKKPKGEASPAATPQ